MYGTSVFLLIDWTWRATLVLAAAGLIHYFLRRASASARHLVWACALAGAVAMPLVSRLAPRWPVPVGGAIAAAPEAALLSVEARLRGGAPSPVRDGQAAPPLEGGLRGGNGLAGNLPYIWLAGTAAVLLYTALGWAGVYRLRRKARPARPAARLAARELMRAMGIRREVVVLETTRAAIPVTWGVFRPVIVVPESVACHAAQLRAVLMHELAHIARHDYLLHVVGQAACALYWFHPLAWLAQRQALRLRERAADDMVLCQGMRASEYAGQLVGLARALAAPRLCGIVAMAHRGCLEQRVRAILDGGTRRMAPGRRMVAAAAVCAALVVAAAASAGVAASQAAQADGDGAPLLIREAETAKARFGARSLEYGRALSAMGAFHQRQDRFDDAQAAFTPALAILEQKAGGQSAELVRPLYFMGLAAHARKDYTLAAQYYQRAADIAGAGGREATLVRLGLVQLACQEGDYNKAAALLQQARAASPGDSLEMAALLDVSAQILRQLGSPADAQAATGEAAAMRQRLGSTRAAPPAAASTPLEIHRAGGGVRAPKLLYKVESEYSQEARALKVMGTVVLRVVVGTDGVAHDIQSVEPLGFGLDDKAVEAVRQWRFEPGSKGGVPVSVAATIQVNFRLT